MSYAKIVKTVASHLTAHGLPVDPIGWSATLDDCVKAGDEDDGLKSLRPLPLLLSEGERIRCAWAVDRLTGELRPSVDALASVNVTLSKSIGDGRRAVLALTGDYALTALASLSEDASLASAAGIGLAWLAIAQASDDRLTLPDAPRVFARLLKGETGPKIEALIMALARAYPTAAAWLHDHRDALIREMNARLIRGCYTGLSAPGELVGVLNGIAIVMVPPDAESVNAARAGWSSALGVKVSARIGWTLGDLSDLSAHDLDPSWAMAGEAPFKPSRGRAARVAEVLGAVREGFTVEQLSASPGLPYAAALAALTAPEELRAAGASSSPEMRRYLRAVGEVARTLASPRAEAAIAGTITLELGDHDEAAKIMLDWYAAQGYQILTLADKLFTSTGGAWRELGRAERAENVREALRGALVFGAKKTYPLMLNQSFIEGVDLAVMQRITTRIIHEHTGAGGQDGPPSPFDRPSPGVPLRDGLLSDDGLIRPICADDRILASTVLDLGYDPAATCPRWLRFLEEVWSDCDDVPERMAFLREWLGAALFGVATKRRGFPLLIGLRRCGKSTLIEVIKSLFPESACSAVTMDRLSGHEAQKSTHSLFGKRLNAVTEHPAGHLPDAAIFKQVVMGESVAAKSLYRDEYTFRPRAAWILGMNDLPTITDTSGAALDRIVPLTFARQFPEDDTIAAALAAERMGIILWAIEGLRSLRGRTAYTVVPSSRAARGDWHTASDSVAAYVAENMRSTGDTFAEEVTLRISTLYTDYAQWCKDGGYKNPVNVNGFSKRLKAIESEWVSAPVRTKPHPKSNESSTTVRAIAVTHLRLRQETDLP